MGDPSEDEDSVLNLFSYNAAVACRQSEGLPLYYTEWNINAFNTSYTNDTKKVAAYAIKNALAIEKSVTGSMFFFLTDLYTDKGMFPRIHVHAQVNAFDSLAFNHHLHQIFAYIMHISLNRAYDSFADRFYTAAIRQYSRPD